MTAVLYKILQQNKCPGCHTVDQLQWVSMGDADHVKCKSCNRMYMVYHNSKHVTPQGD
jgi:Zn ribbon nucleic-acid-binding protein